MKQFLLKQPVLGWRAGQVLEREPEWQTWHVGSLVYNSRNSEIEAEVCLLLDYLMNAKLTTIMVEVEL